MSEAPEHEHHTPRWRDPAALQTAAAVLVIAAAGWFLMVQLAPLLRPLLIAVFLAYVLMPYHSRLRRHVGAPASIGILAGLPAGVIVGLALSVYASVLGLSDELPRLQGRVIEMGERGNDVIATNAPWMHVGDGEQR